jgi:predicted hydrocarbon binding protein
MDNLSIDRKHFLTTVGKICAGSCICAAMGGFNTLMAQDSTKADKSDSQAPKPRSEVRMEFATKWVRRFMNVLDTTLDEETRKKVMMASGKACFLAWINETGQQIKPVTLERYKQWVDEKIKDGSQRVEGNTIYFKYMAAAETGLPSEDSQCLCPLVEDKSEGLSRTYCWCSIGYVKQWYDMLFDKSVMVELTDSVLWGGKRCEFKITV